MAGQPLPDPQWQEAPESCLRCGYSLRGLQPPGPCPECGAPFEARCLVLAGVAQRQHGASPLRKAAYWAIGLAMVVLSQTFPIFLIYGAWWALLALLVVLLGALGWLIATGPRERRGAERFAFTPSGVARVSLTGRDMRDTVFVPWPEGGACTVKRISPFWRRICIGQSTARGKLANIVFEAGVRCPDERAEEVEAAIGDLLARPHPPVARPPHDVEEVGRRPA